MTKERRYDNSTFQNICERNQFEQFLTEHQIKMKNIWVSSNTEAIKQAVLGGEGIAILSRMLIERGSGGQLKGSKGGRHLYQPLR